MPMPSKFSLEKELKLILGESYGGPSIGFEDGQFILYQWFDAPVSTPILERADTLHNLVMKFKKTDKYKQIVRIHKEQERRALEIKYQKEIL